MVLLYLALGWLSEKYLKRPESQVKAFFRIICAPLTRPIARWMRADVFDTRVFRAAVIGAAVAFILLSFVVRRLAAGFAA